MCDPMSPLAPVTRMVMSLHRFFFHEWRLASKAEFALIFRNWTCDLFLFLTSSQDVGVSLSRGSTQRYDNCTLSRRRVQTLMMYACLAIADLTGAAILSNSLIAHFTSKRRAPIARTSGNQEEHVIKSTYPMPMRTATIVEGELSVVPKSPANKSTLDRIPTKAVTLPKILLRSMTNEITSPAPITPLRPAILVAIKTPIPRNGMTAATIDQILLVRLRAA